jgi:hypothetical protein
MLIRLDADGGIDRSFGGGLAGGRGYTVIEGLALRGDHVLGVATVRTRPPGRSEPAAIAASLTP